MSALDEEIQVRAMEIDDLPSVFHLGEQLFTPREFPNLYRTWDPFEVTGLFHSDGEFCFVADRGAALAGFVLGTVIEKARSAWTYGHLLWLGVAPACQRMGVGDRLFEQFRTGAEAHGARMLMIDTQADNAPALAFFRRHGFANPTEHVYLTLNLQLWEG